MVLGNSLDEVTRPMDGINVSQVQLKQDVRLKTERSFFLQAGE